MKKGVSFMENIKIYTINGSPRKNFSTAKLLEHFAEGAKSVGAEVMPINLYDYKYTGCRECYLCKQRNGQFYAQCGFRDDITELLKAVSDADGFAVGAPIFLGDFSAQTKAFLERLLFPFTSYEGDSEFSIAPKNIRTAVFSAMNVTEEFRKENYDVQMENTVHWLEMIFHHRPDTCFATNTYQFTDYGKYDAELWDEADKRKWREEQFPKDCQTAFEIGRRMAETLSKEKKMV